MEKNFYNMVRLGCNDKSFERALEVLRQFSI
jgi:hypothetical protein